MSAPRLPSKAAREDDKLLRELGYRFLRSDGGHMIYEHPRHENLVKSATPSDFRYRRKLLAELRRRHPRHPALLRRKSDRPRKAKADPIARAEARVRAALRAAGPPARDVPPPPPPSPDRTSCIDCGRLWLSDLNPVGRSCPDCGGRVVLGREAA